jgi:hypothetical protein
VRDRPLRPQGRQPDLIQQAAAAYANDMGVTSRRFRRDGRGRRRVVAATAFYTATLAVPARAPGDHAAGEARFDEFGCAACHTPVQTSAPHPIAALADQTFAPYTDLLLHDLGDDLADGARTSSRRPRVAHAAAVGARPGHDRAARRQLPARRPRAHGRGGDPVARRRGRAARERFRTRPPPIAPRCSLPVGAVTARRAPRPQNEVMRLFWTPLVASQCRRTLTAP